MSRKTLVLLALGLLLALLLALPAGGEGPARPVMLLDIFPTATLTATPAQPISPLPTPTPQSYWDPRLTDWGFRLEPFIAQQGQSYWHLIKAEVDFSHADFVYIKAVDEVWQPIQARVTIANPEPWGWTYYLLTASPKPDSWAIMSLGITYIFDGRFYVRMGMEKTYPTPNIPSDTVVRGEWAGDKSASFRFTFQWR